MGIAKKRPKSLVGQGDAARRPQLVKLKVGSHEEMSAMPPEIFARLGLLVGLGGYTLVRLLEIGIEKTADEEGLR